MTYTDNLRSDGFDVKEEAAGTSVSHNNTGSNFELLAATTASSEGGIPLSPNQIPLSPSPLGTSVTPSILGRWEHDLRADVWSPCEKVHISEFAHSTCVELGFHQVTVMKLLHIAK